MIWSKDIGNETVTNENYATQTISKGLVISENTSMAYYRFLNLVGQ